MTKLRKKVQRETRARYHESGKWRAIMVALEPPDLITFRAKGCKTKYSITAKAGFELAVLAEVERKRKEKREQKKKKKKKRSGAKPRG